MSACTIGGVLARIEALVERRLIEADGAGVRLQLRDLQLLLIGEQPVVQLPVLALLAGTVRGLGGLGRLRMVRQREVLEHDPHLAAVLLLELLQGGRPAAQNGHW